MASEYAEHPHLLYAPEHAWFIHFTDSDGAEHITYSDGLAGSVSTSTINSQIDLPLKFAARNRPGQDPPPDVRHRERYRVFKDLAKFAGQYTAFPTRTNSRRERTADGEEYQAEGLLYTEDLPPTAGSLLLKVVPGYQTVATEGLWVLVDALDDETMLENTVCEITVSATIVAWVEDYPDRAGVVRDLEYGGI